jgi:RNA polymerase sigma factor (sigma-70 family)
MLNLRNHPCHHMLILSSQQIVRAFNQKDAASDTWLYENFYDRVTLNVRKLIRNSSDRKDRVSEVFLKLLERRGRFKTLDGFRSYIDEITHNACRDFMRKQQTIREGLSVIEDMYYLVDHSTMEFIEMSISYKTLFYKLVNSLPPKRKAVLLMAIGTPLSDKEIGSHLKISEKTVANLKADVVKKLKMQIEKLRSLDLFLLVFTFLKIFYKQH